MLENDRKIIVKIFLKIDGGCKKYVIANSNCFHNKTNKNGKAGVTLQYKGRLKLSL
jgi:hypothetical protein